MKAIAALSQVTISVSSPKQAFKAKKGSPFWHKEENGLLFDVCSLYDADIKKEILKETGLQIDSYDLYYGFSFTISVEHTDQIQLTIDLLKEFVEKHFDSYEAK